MSTSADRPLEHCSCTGETCGRPKQNGRIRLLQTVTLAWMLVECGVSLFASYQAHSPLLLAFGADSFVELLSASVVLWNALHLAGGKWSLPEKLAGRINGVLLFVLAAVVVLISILSFTAQLKPETSCSGLAITIAALVIMPILSGYKRHLAQQTGNVALAADSVQSATCAYLALITLAGLSVNSLVHLPWIDSLAALAAVPILFVEGRRALRGESCGCC
jgi:divalent metal cation (Fe/Co/Zn/Cd) transporter